MTTTKRLLFWAVILAVPAAFLGLGELVARALVRTEIAHDPRINLVEVPSFFERRTFEGRSYYQITHPEAYGGRRTRFLAEKPAEELRVFCLGGSASAGWPHPPAEIYSEYLERSLGRAYPDRRVQVINASAHAYASYRVRLIFDNVIEHDPDAIVLYTGNNEFIEKRSYLASGLDGVLGLANRSVLFRLMRRELTTLLAPDNVLSGAHREHAEEGLRAKLAQLPVDLREDPQQFARVKEHYRATVGAMVREAERRGVPVVLVTVPSNLRGWHPNVSNLGLEGDARLRWQHRYDRGRRALLEGDAEAAITSLRGALELEPTHAETWFQLARAEEASGDPAAAFPHYERARDLDQNPFRAIGDLNRILRELAAERGAAWLADVERGFAEASAPRAPGFDLFLDYVHPTVRGNVVVARVVHDALVGGELLGAPTGPRAFHWEPVKGPDGEVYDEGRDLRLQLTLLTLFTTMHQYEALVEKAQWIRTLDPGQPIAQRILQVFAPHLELERRLLLGEPVSPRERARIEANVRAFYAGEIRALRPGA